MVSKAEAPRVKPKRWERRAMRDGERWGSTDGGEMGDDVKEEAGVRDPLVSRCPFR